MRGRDEIKETGSRSTSGGRQKERLINDWTHRCDDHLLLSVKSGELDGAGGRKERCEGAEVRVGQSGGDILQTDRGGGKSERDERERTAG